MDNMASQKTKQSSTLFHSKHASELDLVTDIRTSILVQSPKGGRFILWAVVLLCIAGTWWAAVSEVEEITNGKGRVIPSSYIQIIQNLEGGILQNILVAVGDNVSKGQTLLQIDATRYASQFSDNQRQISALDAKIARLQAKISGSKFNVPANIPAEYMDTVTREKDLFETETEEFKTKIAILQAQSNQKEQELEELKAHIEQYRQSRNFLKKELSMTQPLVKKGAVSEVEILRLRRDLNNLEGQLRTAELQIPIIRSKHAEAKRKIHETQVSFQKDAKLEMNKAIATKNTLLSNAVTIQDKLTRTDVKSPVKGIINQILINTVGGVIQPGMDLIEIVPLDDTLLIEAKINPADIAFLHPGQTAMVTFSAYDFTLYGGLSAKLEHISADSIPDENGDSFYLVKVRTDQNYLTKGTKQMPIIPGMPASVDIMTGKKTVLNYLLNPILRAKKNALRER